MPEPLTEKEARDLVWAYRAEIDRLKAEARDPGSHGDILDRSDALEDEMLELLAEVGGGADA